MRHKLSGKTLNRSTNHRRSLMKNQLSQLIVNENLTTTQTKAYLVKKNVQQIISKAKNTSLHNRRQLLTQVFDKKVITKLTNDLVPRYADLKGGFITSKRLKKRRGDNALLIKLELKKAPEKKPEKVAQK